MTYRVVLKSRKTGKVFSVFWAERNLGSDKKNREDILRVYSTEKTHVKIVGAS